MAGLSKVSGRRILTAAVAALVATGALAGCSSGAGGDEGDSGEKNLIMYNDNPQWTKGFEAAGETIRKETGYGIKTQSLPTTENYTQTVLAALPTKKSGDLIKWWSGKMLQGLAATGQLADLTAEWDEAVAAGNLNDALRPYFSLDGKVYAMPLNQSSWVTYYSKKAFADAGITETPKTWDEYETAVEKLGEAGQLMCSGQTGWETFVPFQQIVGSKSTQLYTDITENKAKFTDPDVKDSMKVWKNWIDSGWVTPPDTKFADCPAMMKAGKVGLINMATWYNGFFGEAGLTDADYGAFLTPAMTDGEPPVVVADTAGIAVPKNAPNLDAAKKSLVAWMNTDVQQPWAEYTGDFSANPNVTSDDPVLGSILSQIEEQSPVYINRYYESLPPKLVQSSIATFGGFIVNPDIDATLTELDRQAKQEWAAWDENPSIG
ncbi:extracellular solute-binding protein [Microbacterium sp. H1-D42]|uniref:ABC transporter substrate-binding protein n=1 Tax=Microbacterium sp. H1-D42 TaxID=2925844 RepID=UPI001F53029A|nr:extracellular solute-binding protein [Microbacterium sp. H1-D42]UNK70500.1 extracellular solute-binding protein [Microbacterium sp. H1-D42]